MSTLLTDESRQTSNIESLKVGREVTMALNDAVMSLGAVATLRSLAAAGDSRLPTQVHMLDTALDMTTKKPNLPHELPPWTSVASLVNDLTTTPSALQITSRCSSASMGDAPDDAGLDGSKEKRPKPTNNHKKSYVWRHFRHPKKNVFFSEEESVIEEDKSKTECVHCGAILAFNQSGTTTTMLNHLKSRHGDITAAEEEKRREERQLNGSPKNKTPKTNKPVKPRKKSSTPIGPMSLSIPLKNESPFSTEHSSLPVALNLSTNPNKLKIVNSFCINNNTFSNNGSSNLSRHVLMDQAKAEIPSPISDGQTSGRGSIGTVESSSALMIASPGSADSDSTGPRRVKKRKRTASADSQGNACAGPSPSSGAGSPHRGHDWDSVSGTGHGVSTVEPVATGRLLSYIVKDLNPPEALDSENFQNLLPGVKTWSSGELRSTVMPSRVMELEQQLKQRLMAPETTSAVAVECWDHHGALMASVGTQFLNHTGPCYRMLKTQEYCESVPLSKILSCLTYYELTKARFLPIVSNEAQTLRDELENIQPDGSSHTVVLPCFTTILNKVLNDAVSYCSPIADLTPKLMDYAKPRTWQSEKWLYYYDAIIRVNREIAQKGDAVLENQTTFSSSDIALIKSLTPILVQLCELSKKFNSLEPTASVVLPLVRHLVETVLLPDEHKDGKVIAMFKQSARLQLEHNFLSNAKVTDTLALSTLLDPRHKRNSLFEEDEVLRQRTISDLRRLVAEEEAREQDLNSSNSNGSPLLKRPRHEAHELKSASGLDMSVVFNEDCVQRPCQVTAYASASTWSLSASSTNAQVMDWWRVHREDFPIVARIAMRYFVIPANCAPASIFSPAGPMAYRSRRALLQREDMNSLLFLHHNL